MGSLDSSKSGPRSANCSRSQQILRRFVGAFDLSRLLVSIKPIVREIDGFELSRNHSLAVMFEANVGPGRLLAATLDLTSDLDQRPAACQLRASLLAYAASNAFKPKQTLSMAQANRLFSYENKIHKH